MIKSKVVKNKSEETSMPEIRITRIKKISREREQENWEFRSMIKAAQIKSELIDEAAHAIYNDLKTKIKCTSCGYCCKNITPIISEADVKRIAAYFKISVKSAMAKWFQKDENLGLIMNTRPCPFFLGKICSIYPARPHDCRSYPHLHKKGLIRYFTSIYSHIGLCPLVFNFYEGMKKKFLIKLDKSNQTWL